MLFLYGNHSLYIKESRFPLRFDIDCYDLLRSVLKCLEHHHIFNDFTNYEFDFFIENFNLLIEYDGIQHFKPIEIFGGLEEFEKQKIRDKIKDDYCKNKNIHLLRIPYTIKNIDDFIEEYFVNHLRVS